MYLTAKATLKGFVVSTRSPATDFGRGRVVQCLDTHVIFQIPIVVVTSFALKAELSKNQIQKIYQKRFIPHGRIGGTDIGLSFEKFAGVEPACSWIRLISCSVGIGFSIVASSGDTFMTPFLLGLDSSHASQLLIPWNNGETW
jgi:hypothetical protein